MTTEQEKMLVSLLYGLVDNPLIIQDYAGLELKQLKCRYCHRHISVALDRLVYEQIHFDHYQLCAYRLAIELYQQIHPKGED